jgi:hypothetical protein
LINCLRTSLVKNNQRTKGMTLLWP